MFKKLLLSLLLVVALASPSYGQITVPHTFTTTVPTAQLNTNFSTLGAGALARSGGTITGNITVNSGITIDGVDIGAVLGGTGTPTFSTVTITGAGAALTVNNRAVVNSTAANALDVAGGITAGTGNVGIIQTDGRIPAISSTYFASLSGANLTAVPLSSLSGAWSSVSYAGGDYTASGGMTWTVAAGDFTSSAYVRMGNTLHWTLQVASTTVTAPLSNELRIDLPGAVTLAKYCFGTFANSDAGTAGVGFYIGVPGSSYLGFYRNYALANWTASADLTSIGANITCEVQ